jgi:hypothetical protein
MEKAQIQGMRDLSQEMATVWGRYAIYTYRGGRKICRMFGLSKETAYQFAGFYEGAIVEEMY